MMLPFWFPSSIRSLGGFALLWLVLFAVGCSSRTPLSRYGESEGAEARLSPDANSVFRRLCEEQNRSTMRLGNLSPRAAERLDTILWSPRTFDHHDEKTLTWMRDWLRRGNKTLVYVGRDYSAYADYWSECAREHWSKPESSTDRESGAVCFEIAASAQASLSAMRYAHRDKQLLPWCLVDNTKQRTEVVNSFRGEWAADMKDQEHRVVVRGSLAPLATVDLQSLEKDLEAIVKTNNAATTNTTATPPFFGGRRLTGTEEDESNLRRIKEYRTDELLDDDPQLWLQSSGGIPLLSSVGAEPGSNSRVILVSTPSLIANYNLTFSGNLKVARRLIDTLPPGKIGFLSTEGEPRVLQDGETEQQKGFEMLTMWPINIITLHAAFLGLLVLVALFPIFGRPKLLPVATSQDFSDHIDALGALLFKSGDRFYALSTIADYYRNVRKDIHSPWAKCEEGSSMRTDSPFGAPPSTVGDTDPAA